MRSTGSKSDRETIVGRVNEAKSVKYAALTEDLGCLLGSETDSIAVLSNAASLIHERMGFFWTGFYLVGRDSFGTPELVLGPFQGPPACMRIAYGKGVCGTAWAKRKTQIVSDVEQFPGHIACSSRSRSEIVVPLFDVGSGEVFAVLDIDSERLATFDETDAFWLERICRFLAEKCK